MLPANGCQVPASVSSMHLGSGTEQSSIGSLEEGVGLALSEQRARFHFEFLKKSQPSEPMFIEVWCESLSRPLPISSQCLYFRRMQRFNHPGGDLDPETSEKSYYF